MKKIYSLIAAVTLTSASFAQNTAQAIVNTPTKKVTTVRSFDKNNLKAVKQKQTQNVAKVATGNSGWFNYGTSIEALINTTSDLNSNYLFPDSMAYGDFGGTFAPTWIHHLAEGVDFRSPAFSGDASTSWVATGNAFKIDSMSIVYAYTRNHPNVNIVDTLIVTVYDNQTAANIANSGFIGTTAANYGTDTLTFKRVGYNSAGNFIAAPTATTGAQVAPVGQNVFKILLTVADTAVTSYREKAFALPTAFNSLGGKLVFGDVQFRPGYTYTLTQQIDATANTFFFTSLEENGATTFPTYFDCNYGSALCDYNCSYIVPQDVRYNMAGSWNYRFIPSFAYGDTYGFEHHLISFHLTDDFATGINNVAQNTFGLTQNMPNPFTKESVVKFNLYKDVNSAVFTVTDIMGRIVTSEKVATTAGTHSVKLGAYAAGVYYYSLNVDGNVTTKKMIVE
jgi:hypothetical protein